MPMPYGGDEIPTIVDRLHRLGSKLDRSLHDLRRSWSELERRVGPLADGHGRNGGLRALGDTVGGLAHNFNNSLAAILGYTELLLKNAGDDLTRRQLAVVRQVALEAASTVRGLQEFVAREPQVGVGPVALPVVVAEALALTEARWKDGADRQGVRFTITRDVESAPLVDGNHVELRNLFVHLILSALDAMPGGGPLAIRARADEAVSVVVDVSDAGTAERRLDQAAAIAERQGGSLRLARDGREGTTVRLRLPGSRYQIIPTAPTPQAIPADRVRRILLVDDDARLLRALTDLLEAHGHVVVSAGSGEEGLERFDPAAVDLVVTDLGMPDMTGWTVAAEVKRRAPHIPVFLLTGWGETVADDERSGYVDRVIAKPVSAAALLTPLGEIARSDARQAT
jgi:CheY-like chemotaxis protein